MKRFVLLILTVFAMTAAQPKVGILEELLTQIVQAALTNLDPASVSYTELHITSHSDTDLFFIFRDAQISEFSLMQITEFVPPIATHEVLASAKLERFVAHANNYTTIGTLKGEPYEATGAMDFAANMLDATIAVSISNFTFTPFHICLTEHSLKVDLSGESFEAAFENALDLNTELNAHGAELVQELQDKINAQANDVINWVNYIFCGH